MTVEKATEDGDACACVHWMVMSFKYFRFVWIINKQHLCRAGIFPTCRLNTESTFLFSNRKLI